MPDPPNCSPVKEDWDTLRQPLTSGERTVADLLYSGLCDPWEIYLQPHINGMIPDFVLLHPSQGVVILEVKDWSGSGPDIRRLHSAIATSEMRIREIADLYCPEIDEHYSGRVAHRFVFPYLSREAFRSLSLNLKEFIPAQFITADNLDELLLDNVQRALPRTVSDHVIDATTDLRSWFTEPEFSREQRRPLILDSRQEELLNEDPARRVINGPAGSGKSQLIAARAAKLARDGKRVLVLSFNITLVNYLRDLAVRWPDPSLPSKPIRENVVFLNFHQLAKRICIEAGFHDEYKSLWGPSGSARNTDALRAGLAKLLRNVLDGGQARFQHHDAILIDEGQDFRPGWLQALPGLLRKKGQMWVAVDLTQDIYERGEHWPKDLFKGLGFRQPAKLKGSYRLHPTVISLAAKFTEDHLRRTLVDSPEGSIEEQAELGDFSALPPRLRWIQIPKHIEVSALATVYSKEIWKLHTELVDPAIAEIIFLCSTHELGLAIVKGLSGKGVKVRHTFDKNSDPPRRKLMAFFKGDSRIKGTTIHSFKGWESRVLLMHIPAGTTESNKRLVYTGLTRLLNSRFGSALTVLCQEPDLELYGRNWPDLETNLAGGE